MYELLSKSDIFESIDPDQITELLAGEYELRHYSHGDVIALQGGRYVQLLIVTEGNVTAETSDSSGSRIDVEQVTAPSAIAPSFLFAQHNQLPATLTARGAVTVIAIPRDELTGMLMRSRQFLLNFLKITSSGNKFISEKVVYLTYKTIKGRFANYLLGLLEKQPTYDDVGKRDPNTVVNPLTQREMAAVFGVTRPALARAMGEMAAEGTVFIKGKYITVLFAEKLKHYARDRKSTRLNSSH